LKIETLNEAKKEKVKLKQQEKVEAAPVGRPRLLKVPFGSTSKALYLIEEVAAKYPGNDPLELLIELKSYSVKMKTRYRVDGEKLTPENLAKEAKLQ